MLVSTNLSMSAINTELGLTSTTANSSLHTRSGNWTQFASNPNGYGELRGASSDAITWLWGAQQLITFLQHTQNNMLQYFFQEDIILLHLNHI